MKPYRVIAFSILMIPLFYFVISCNGKSLESSTGTVSISVVDNDSENTPIPDVKITITPGNMVKKTDTEGLCSFDLPPGDYYINASVCCAGPGNIDYHELVTVVKNETKEVILEGCLSCL